MRGSRAAAQKRPILIMGHTDVVNVDPKKWTHPPFGAERADGYIYGRGTTDDKDNVTAALMAILLLKRNNVPLDRDVIFLAEAGEEGNTRFGIEPMVNEHYDAIDAEYCIAEVGNVVRANGAVRYATVATAEKLPKGIDLIAHGPSGHGSIPLETNAVTHLARAVAAVAQWQPPVVLNATTRTYFERLAAISAPEQAAPVSRGVEHRPAGGCGRGCVAARERAAARVDAAHVRVAEHRAGRLSQQHHSVRGARHARRAHAAGARTRTRFVPSSRASINDPSGRSRVQRVRRAARGRCLVRSIAKRFV